MTTVNLDITVHIDEDALARALRFEYQGTSVSFRAPVPRPHARLTTEMRRDGSRYLLDGHGVRYGVVHPWSHHDDTERTLSVSECPRCAGAIHRTARRAFPHRYRW